MYEIKHGSVKKNWEQANVRFNSYKSFIGFPPKHNSHLSLVRQNVKMYLS